MTATMPTPTRAGRNISEDYEAVLPLMGLECLRAAPSAPEPWRSTTAGATQASLSGGWGLRLLVEGAAVVLISTVGPSLVGAGGGSLLYGGRGSGGATQAPAPAYVASVGRRRDEQEDEVAAPVAALAPAATPAPAPTAFVTAGSQVDAVQEALGLSITDLARLVGVSRVTVYEWLRGKVTVPNSASAQQRLAGLLGVAEQWRQLASAPLGGLMRAVVTADGRSLLDLLAAEMRDTSAIDTALARLATVFARAEEVRAKARPVGTGTADATAEDMAAAEGARIRRAHQRARALRRRG